MAIYLSPKQAVKCLWPTTLLLYGCPLEHITRPQEKHAGSVALFAKHLQPKIKDYKCNRCHVPDGSGPSHFAVDDAQAAHDVLLPDRVNLDSPINSAIVKKVGKDNHNCPPGTTCGEVANTLSNAIEKWAKELGDARVKIIKTESQDISTIVPGDPRKIFEYGLKDLVNGTPPPPSSTIPSDTMPRSPSDKSITLEVEVNNPSNNGGYRIKKLEIKTNIGLYVGTISPVLNGNKKSQTGNGCKVTPPGYNFLKDNGEIRLDIKDDKPPHNLYFRFQELRRATEENDKPVCDEKQPNNGNGGESVPANIRRIIERKCATAGCHGGTTVPNLTDVARIIALKDNQGLPDRVTPGATRPMPPRNAQQQLSNEERTALLNWLGN